MKDNAKFCLFTNDVETTSIINHCLSDKTGEKVLKDGMPKLLELYSKYNVKSTFFFTGYIAKRFPEIVKMILPYEHEVGCHSYSHELCNALDLLSYEQQVDQLLKAKRILEDISGEEVISFRAPALRVNNYTHKALLDVGFKIDSSSSSQRTDMLFSYGSMKKMNWLFQPRLPYFTKENNIWKKGNSELYEIPISAIGIPYIGTFMRIAQTITRGLRYILNIENSINHKPIVFLIHPNELITEEKSIPSKSVIVQNRTNNKLAHYFKDILRQKLKNKNLGNNAISLFENEIKFFHQKGYEFLTMREFYIKKRKKERSYGYRKIH